MAVTYGLQVILLAILCSYTYILQSLGCLDKEYVGHTSDLRNCLEEHNSGKCFSTSKIRPWKDISSRREHIIQFLNTLNRCGVAESFYILVFAFLFSPFMIRPGNFLNIFCRKFLCPPVYQMSFVACVNKKNLIDPVSVAAISFVPTQEP